MLVLQFQSPLYAGKPQPLPAAVGNPNIIWHGRVWLSLCGCHTDSYELHSLTKCICLGKVGVWEPWHQLAQRGPWGWHSAACKPCWPCVCCCWEVALPCSLWAMPGGCLGESNLLQPKTSQGPLSISLAVWIIALHNPGTSWSSSFASTDRAVVSLPALSLCLKTGSSPAPALHDF